MTAKKDLKRRIRDRQAQTGESYVTARRQVLAAAPTGPAPQASAPEPTPPNPEPPKRPVIHVDEIVEVTREAEPLGFRCEVVMTRSLADRVDTTPLLRQLRATIDATRGDPSLARMREVMLHGIRVKLPQVNRGHWLERTKQFLQRARAGIGGVSEHGDMFALAIDGKHARAVMVLVHIGWLPRPGRERVASRVSLSVIGDASDGLDSMSVLFLP